MNIRPIFSVLVAFVIQFYSYSQVQAVFTADTTSSCDPLLVTFTDQSTGSITSWSWDFGNGSTSILQNPSINFSQKKSYTITLTVSDGTNTDTETKVDYISIYNKPNANFSVTPKRGCEPLTVSFQDNSTLGDIGIREYKWDFGDGSLPGTSKNQNHTYQNKGIYPLSLQITDSNKCISTIKKDSIEVLEAPIAEFESYNRPDTCGAPYTVNFKNNSKGVGLTYFWMFGDGNTSSQTEPTHTYLAINNYTVTLVAISSNCSDTLELVDYVKLAAPEADFELGVDTICLNDTLTFTNNSTLANRYLWDFGDGTSSSAKSPKKVYNTGGLMEITLTARTGGTDCSSDTSKFVFVSEVTANFSIIDTFSCYSEKMVGLIDQSNSADSLAWLINIDLKKFPDSSKYTRKGNSSLFVNKSSSEYVERSGNYIFTQIAKNKFGCADTITKVDSIILYDIGIAIDYPSNDSVTPWVMRSPCSPPGPSFIGGCLPFGIDFNSLYTGPGRPISWNWTFGNGDSSKSENPPPVHYKDTSIYGISLEVVDDSGCVLTDTATVLGSYKPTADFSIATVIDTVCAGDTIVITDLTKTVYGNHLSNFILTGASDQENFEHFDTKKGACDYIFTQFVDTGMFDIQHIVNNHGCFDTLYKEDQVYVLGPIVSGVEFYADDCNDPKTVNFSAKVIDATGFEWDFGDTTFNTTELEPVHTYQRFGEFYASFKAWNDSTGCDTLVVDSIIVRIYEIAPLSILAVDRVDFLDLGKNFCYDLKDTILIREPNAGIYSRYFWKINGDTIRNKTRTFRHVFKEKGLQIIELETTDYLGCEYYFRDTFYVSRPEAKIGIRLLEPCYPVEVEFFDNSESDTLINDWYWKFAYQDTSVIEVDTRFYAEPRRRNAYLRVENIFGCADSVFAINFLNSQVLDVGFLAANIDICEGDTVTFRNVSTGSDPTYSWDFGDGTVVDTNDTFVKHVYDKGGSYDITLSGTDDNGCTINVEKPKLVVVDSAVIAGFTSDTAEANCYPLAVFFEDTSTGGTVSSWEWTFGDGANSVLENPFHNYTEVGQFDVFLKVTTKNGCSDSILAPAYIKTKGPIATFSMSKKEACVNELVTFSITSSSNLDQYSWSFGDGFSDNNDPSDHAYSAPGEYYPSIVLTNNSGNCVVEISDTITILDVIADFTVNDDTACVPFTAAFNNQSRNENSLLWRFGNGNTSIEENPNITYNNPGRYEISLAITSDAGCIDTAYKTIEVFPYPILTTTPDTGLCEGDSITLSASGGLTYAWRPSRYLNRTTGSQVISRPDSTITYTVLSQNIAGCESSGSIEVFVPQKPTKSLLRDTTINIGERIDLNVEVGQRYKYRWVPPDGLSCDICPNPVASPLISRTYIVTIFDSYGCFSITDTIEIKVTEMYTLDVPKAFSPNGDGINDLLFPRGLGIKGLIKFKIYNRFGELIFESNDFNKGWDGTYRGKPQNIETYIYTIEATTYGNRTLHKKGNISLLR